MSATYTFNEIINLIDNATKQEISILCSLISEEKAYYTPFQLRVMAAAVHIRAEWLCKEGQPDEQIRQSRQKLSSY